MLISLEGEEATGKTTFAYTAPLKVVGFSFDMGAQRALFGAKADLFEGLTIGIIPYVEPPKPGSAALAQWKDYDITVYEMPRPVQLDAIKVRGARALWAYFIQLFVEAMQDPTVHSVALDTATIARRVRVDAHLEALQDAAGPKDKMRERLLQIEYGTPNDAIRDLYNLAQGTKKNLIATHHLTNEYKDHINSKGDREQVITGNRVLEGLAGTYRFVDVALLMEGKGKGVKATMLKCGYNLGQKGMPLDNPTWNSLANLISMGLGDRLEFERRAA